MLPDIQLDQTTFEEMIEQAKNKIVSSYPEWTDFNYHDPGITLVELFAWLKEIQQYELNNVSDEHRYRYLKLLGFCIQHRTGAKTYACANPDKHMLIPKGSRLNAPGIVFETVKAQTLVKSSINRCFGLLDGKKVSYLDGDQLNFEYAVEFYPFGREAVAGSSLYVGFSDALPNNEVLYLTIDAESANGRIRNPADENTIPLAQISYSYWDGGKWSQIEIIEDETFGFLYDGQLIFSLPSEMKSCTVDGEESFYLRMTLQESYYDLPPVFSFIDINTMKVCQKETVAVWLEAQKDPENENTVYANHNLCGNGKCRVFAELDDLFYEANMLNCRQEGELGLSVIKLDIKEEDFARGKFWITAFSDDEWYDKHKILGIARGFPNESFALDEELLSYEDIEILVEEAEKPGVYKRWEKKADFSHSGAEDNHYRIDGLSGRILFGDCFKGRAPEGKILLVSYARVMGDKSNIKAHKISGFQNQAWSHIPVTNFSDAQGGRNEETMQDAFIRVRKKLRESRNMVTLNDYEQAVLRTPGLCVESCKAIAASEDPGKAQSGIRVMQLVVKPASLEKRPKMSSLFAQNIRNYLEPKRLLGIELRLLSPVYVRLSVYIEVKVHPQYQDAQGLVERAAFDYLTPFKNDFGGIVSYSGLYGYLDRLSCVSSVSSLMLEGKGNGVRKNNYGDLMFPGNGVADEIEIHCSCSVME